LCVIVKELGVSWVPVDHAPASSEADGRRMPDMAGGTIRIGERGCQMVPLGDTVGPFAYVSLPPPSGKLGCKECGGTLSPISRLK
jgi:hypothetical protein